jgi:hypothetical protein
MTRPLFGLLALAIAFTAPSTKAMAQQETAAGYDVEKDIALLRRNLRSEKKKLIAANVPLTETEATKFWPVYDQYTADMSKQYDKFYALIKEYAAVQKTITDAQASDMLKRWAAIQVDIAQTRQKHVPLIEKVIAGRKAAHFFQIDRRLYSLLDLQIATEVPLVIQ